MILTTNAPAYTVANDWGRLPEGYKYAQVAGVAVDSQDRVFVFHRGEHPVIVFDRDGNFLYSWGDGMFAGPHAFYIGPDDLLWLVDRDDHVIQQFTLDGKHLMDIGVKGQTPGQESGLPFNLPAGFCQATDGTIYIADGYGNSRIHVYTSGGKWVKSWGSKGDGPGQFNLPHGVWVTRDDRVIVSDRQNSRLQLFDREGNYVDTWSGFARPCHVYEDAAGLLYVAELDFRVSVLASDGTVLTRIGGARDEAPGGFMAPHEIWADSHGDFYVAEVLQAMRLQKFTRQR